MTNPGVRDKETECLHKESSSSSYLFLHLPQWQTLPGMTWDGANHPCGYPIPMASFTELPDTLATSKILSTKDESSGLEANWGGAVCICMFNRLLPSKNPPSRLPVGRSPWLLLTPGPCPQGFAGWLETNLCQEWHQQFHKVGDPVPPLVPMPGYCLTHCCGPSLALWASCGQPQNEALPPDVPPWKSLVGWPLLQRRLGRVQELWRRFVGNMQDSLATKPGHATSSPGLH